MIPSVGIIIFNSQKTKVLLERHGNASLNIKGKIGFPGGQILNREHVDVALTKLYQESGLLANRNDLIELPFEYTAFIDRADGTRREFSMVNYLCTKWKGELVETEEDKPFWADISSIDSLDLLPNVAKAVHDALTFISKKSL
jgi:hypothetical protein